MTVIGEGRCWVETRKQRSVARSGSVEDIIMTTCGDDEDDIIIVVVFDRCYSMLLLPPAPSVTLSCCHHEHASPRASCRDFCKLSGVPTADILTSKTQKRDVVELPTACEP